MTNIFVANLDFGISSDDLKATFSQFGTVLYAHVVYDKKTKKSKGYGYVEMESLEEAIAAIKALNGVEVEGRPLDIKIATPKNQRPEKENSKKAFKNTKEERPKRQFRVKDAPSSGEVKRVLRPRKKKD
ncbi:MAG: hypothetical protein WC994_01090 [Brumimicrobium sp.]